MIKKILTISSIILLLFAGCNKDKCKIKFGDMTFVGADGSLFESCEINKLGETDVDKCVSALFNDVKDEPVTTLEIKSNETSELYSSCLKSTNPDNQLTSSSDNLVIFPNPFSNILNIVWPSSFYNKLISIKIVDADVNVIFSGTYKVGETSLLSMDTESMDLENNKIYAVFIASIDTNYTIINTYYQQVAKIDGNLSPDDDFCEKLNKKN